MTTVATKATRKKPERFVRLLYPVGTEIAGLVRITLVHPSGRVEMDDYEVSPMPSDFGDGFRLKKPVEDGGEVYEVNLSDEGHLCCCKGFLKHQHCKHTAALAKLRDAGRI
jgi:hypothetical protein